MTNRRQPRYQKGQRIANRFLVHQALMGGMGEVYLCLDEYEEYPYALKTFQGSDLRMKEVFEGEVANWIALEKHPNIVRLFYMTTLDSIPFMVLEWIANGEGRGTDLRSWLRHGSLDLSLALRFTIDILRGLHHANNKSPGIVHRDLKPDNILVDQTKQAKVTDFGLAMIAQQSNISMETEMSSEIEWGDSMRVGRVVGTPPYMPPEQWRGETILDFRTDIYAVGCILYELLTGRLLFEERSIAALRQQHLEAPVPKLTGDFPNALSQILEGCLAKKAGDRFDNIEVLLWNLEKVFVEHTSEPVPAAQVDEFTAGDYINRGTTYYRLGQTERSIRDFTEAIRREPNLVEAYSNRAVAYIAAGEFDRALADVNRAIAANADHAPAYNNRGNLYANLGQHQRAISDYDRAIELNPLFAEAYSSRGNSYGWLAEPAKAITDFDRAIELDPYLGAAYQNKAAALFALGQIEEAIKLSEKAAELGDKKAIEFLPTMRQQLTAISPNSSYTQDLIQAFVSTTSLQDMHEALLQYPFLAQMITSLEQSINDNVPVTEQPAFRQRLEWLKQAVQQLQAQQFQQLVTLYQEHGEHRLRQVLMQQGVSPAQITEIIALIKRNNIGD